MGRCFAPPRDLAPPFDDVAAVGSGKIVPRRHPIDHRLRHGLRVADLRRVDSVVRQPQAACISAEPRMPVSACCAGPDAVYWSTRSSPDPFPNVDPQPRSEGQSGCLGRAHTICRRSRRRSGSPHCQSDPAPPRTVAAGRSLLRIRGRRARALPDPPRQLHLSCSVLPVPPWPQEANIADGLLPPTNDAFAAGLSPFGCGVSSGRVRLSAVA